jgi:hypothetical protein
LHAGKNVLVHAHRERDAGVPETLAHHLGWDTCGESEGRPRVPEIMEADPWHAGAPKVSSEGGAEAVRMDRAPVWKTENEVIADPLSKA